MRGVAEVSFFPKKKRKRKEKKREEKKRKERKRKERKKKKMNNYKYKTLSGDNLKKIITVPGHDMTRRGVELHPRSRYKNK